MNPRNLLVAVAAVIVLGAAFTLRSQGLTDGIKVTLPEPVTVGEVVLDPGDYEIRRASTATDQVLQIFSKDKLRYQTNVLTIPALEKDTPEDSKVILHHIGDKYYFDKIFMQGKDYGYEFVLPDRVRALQRELAVTVPARYESNPINNEASEASEAKVESPAIKTSEAPESASPVAAVSQREAQERERQATLDREREEQLARDREAEQDRVAALQQSPAPAAQAPVTPGPVDARQDRTSSDTRNNAQNRDELPATASDWFVYILGGTVLIAMAAFFRKPQTQHN
jgi:hypothetical protein